jgi:hypothetical protein
MVLDHLLPSLQPESFLEWTLSSVEESLTEFYTILLEEHLEVAIEMLEVAISSQVSKTETEWFSDVQIW